VPGNWHAGFGRRLGETHRSKHRQGAPSRPHTGRPVGQAQNECLTSQNLQEPYLGASGRHQHPIALHEPSQPEVVGLGHDQCLSPTAATEIRTTDHRRACGHQSSARPWLNAR